MPRYLVRFVLLLWAALAMSAQEVSNPCRESEVPLDGMHSAARLTGCTDDASRLPLLWYLDRIDQIPSVLDGRYDRSGAGEGSVLYVMDTGVLASHAEFATAAGTRVVGGFDATTSLDLGRSTCVSADKATAPCYASFDELPASSHGTSVASIAAGRNVGVAPAARVVSIRVMNERGLATTRTYLDGLDAIIRHASDPANAAPRTSVVNISGWVLESLKGMRPAGEPVPFAVVERKIRDMIGGVDATGRPDPDGHRFLFVVAANNTDGGCGPSGVVDRFPATLGVAIPGVITVGGMTADNVTWRGSCRGGVEILAPAEGIFSASITATDHYRGVRPNLRSGTSFAAPIVAGIAARLLADRPDLSPQQVESWIEASPSRVWNPTSDMAEGKVAYIRSIALPAAGSPPFTPGPAAAAATTIARR